MARLFANNAAGLLASSVTGSATSLSLVTGQGALFPSPTAGYYFLLTLSQGSPPETSWEIVKVTARSSDTLTIVRGQEGTTATSWASGSKVELRLTAGIMAPLAAPAGATVDGYLSSTDWSAFNGKQAAGTYATGTGTASGTNTGDQTALPNPQALSFTATGGAAMGSTYSGSAALTVDYSSVGAAPASHTHSYEAADADLLAIAGLSGSTGYLKKTAADTWTLDTSTFATLAGAESLTNKTLSNPTVTNYTEAVVALGTVTSANTIALTNGTVQTATLSASTACTFTMPTATAGKSFILLLKQAASTGNGSATFTGVKWGTSGAPTITATAGKMDILSFVSDGTSWYGSAGQGYTP